MSDPAMPTTFDGVRTSPNLTLSLERALDHARDLRQPEVTIEHLLLALTDDPDATGSLEACGVDIARLKTDIATYVDKTNANTPEGAAVSPGPSATLRALLQQSVEAAREAKRQDINSFIVLAAIVGQEKSEAATILQAHGFTFIEAIEALKPRLARTEEAGDAKSAAATRGGAPRPAQPPAPRPPESAPEMKPTVANIEEALAQSADALPPLPSARPVRRPAAVPSAAGGPSARDLAVQRPQAQPPRAPRPGSTENVAPTPAASASPAAPKPRDGLQSVEDIMASVRDKMGPPRPTAAPAPPPRQQARRLDEPATPSAAAKASPPAAAGARAPAPMSTGPQASPPKASPSLPMPPAQPDGARRPPADIYDLGVPLPEDRIAKPPRPGAAIAHRREPSLGTLTPTAGAAQVAAAPSLGQMRPSREPMPAPVPPPSLSPAGPPSHNPSALARPAAGQQPAAAPSPPSLAPPGQAPRAGAPPQKRAVNEAINPGQLAEAIPRTMRLWVPEKIEVRIARRSVDTLTASIEGRGVAARHDILITSAMSVRLKAPDGGFAIDALSPETQWIESRPALLSSDEFASWRWTVRPLRKGRARLHLIVSARTPGSDGGTAETALPDQVIEIRVRTNWGMVAKRYAGWITAAVIGGVFAKFGESAFEIARKMTGL